MVTPPALQARALYAGPGQLPLLQGVTLDIAAGRWTSVVGPNGAGKSTLLKALAGLLPAQGAGQVWLLGQPLAALPARQRARQLAWLGQNETGADDLRAWDVVLLGRLPHQPWLSAPTAADHAAAEQALHATGAWALRTRCLGALSGGERQRVLLARALAVQAPVLLMDEPLANLDPNFHADWLQLVQRLVAQGRTVVSVLHEIAMALHADDVVVLQQGRVVHHGSSGEAATHRALEQVFDQRIAVHRLLGQWVTLPVLPGGPTSAP